MNTTIILLCVGIAWTAICLLIADLLFSDEWRIDRRIKEYSQPGREAANESSPLFGDWSMSDARGGGIVFRIQTFVRQTGLPLTARHLWVASGWCATAGALLALVVHPWWWAAAVMSPAIPWIAISWVRYRRLQRLRRQLPEAFDVMRRAVEAGQTVPNAFHQVSTHCDPPLSLEFARCGEHQNLGLSHDAALRELVRRVPVTELKIFVISLSIQRQCGGSPVEILQNMASLFRKRHRFAQRVQTLTAEGRLQAIVLTALPVVTFVGLILLWPDYIAPLLARPQLVMAAAALQVIGALWVRRTVQLNY